MEGAASGLIWFKPCPSFLVLLQSMEGLFVVKRIFSIAKILRT
jgi:hypothetical protein